MENEGSKKLGSDINKILNEKKGEHLDKVIEKSIVDKITLTEILRGLKSKNETFRYNCFKVLFQISKAQPFLNSSIFCFSKSSLSLKFISC